MRTKKFLSELMSLAWGFVKRNGYTISEAMKCAWANMKLKLKMSKGIIRFYFQKVDGSAREAWGTLSEKLVPSTSFGRKRSETVQTYFDTERAEWRCFKKVNLLSV